MLDGDVYSRVYIVTVADPPFYLDPGPTLKLGQKGIKTKPIHNIGSSAGLPLPVRPLLVFHVRSVKGGPINGALSQGADSPTHPL